ncbi:hypothetical protein GC176_10465 [bacterium]|nr:hypothetical protein [bacterium]
MRAAAYSSIPFVLFTTLLTVSLAGCGGGDSGPPRLQIKGAITFDGQPIPAGTITFVPDASQGNQGPASNATIVNGAYTITAGSKGVVGGPNIARIAAFDGNARPEAELPLGELLFPEYEMEINVPTAGSSDPQTVDLNVPKDAARPQQKARRSASDDV